MDEDNRKLVILDLTLALIVLALFGMSSLTFNNRHADPELIQEAIGVRSDNDVRTFAIPGSRTPVLRHVSMKMTNGSTSLPEFGSEIPGNSASGAIAGP